MRNELVRIELVLPQRPDIPPPMVSQPLSRVASEKVVSAAHVPVFLFLFGFEHTKHLLGISHYSTYCGGEEGQHRHRSSIDVTLLHVVGNEWHVRRHVVGTSIMVSQTFA